MTPEEVKKLTNDVFERIWNQGEVEAVHELFTPGFVNHEPAVPDLDAAGYKAWVTGNRAAFPDFHVELDDIVIGEDKGGVRWTVTGTHHGELALPAGTMPATGREVKFTGVTLFRLEDDRVAELWHYADRMTQMRQLGMLPEAAAP